MIKTEFQVNASCKRCKMHETADHRSRGLRGRNVEGHRALLIFTDYPDYFANHAHQGYKLDVKDMLDWLLLRMSVPPEKVGYDYTLRCYPARELPSTKAARATCIEECAEYRFTSILRIKPKAIVALGKVSMEAFTGRSQIGDSEGRKHLCWEPIVREICEKIWVGYGINGILTAAGDTPRVFRVLYKAAEEAGLKPKIDPTVPPFRWRNLI